MKTTRCLKLKNVIKFIRLDADTWIEKKTDEPDEVVRQRYMIKLSRFMDSPKLRAAH